MESGRAFNVATVLAAVVVLAAGALSVIAVRSQAQATEWVAHTQEVIARLEGALAMLTTAESAERAYLLTGDARVLDNFAATEQAAVRAVADVAKLTVDNATQQQRLPRLQAAVAERFQLLRRAIELRWAGESDAAVNLVRTLGLGQMDRLRLQLQVMLDTEEALLNQRLETAQETADWVVGAVAGTALIALIALTGLYLLSRRHAARLAAEQGELRRSREQTLSKAAELEQANRQLRESADLLEERVAERTAALADANAELEGFARTVAHDLRAPLRNVQGYAAAVLEQEAERLSAEGRTLVQRLAVSASRMEALIADLLAYSRLARAQLKLEPVALDAVVREVLDEMRSELLGTGAEVELAESMPAVLAHRLTLVRVVANLVSNSLKFVAPGALPKLRITAARQDGSVELCVGDRGIGISPEDQERIFSVFERLHGQENYPGTGIGLAIVRKGMERMGGEVGVSSRPGEGSQFRLRLRPGPAEAPLQTAERALAAACASAS